VNPAVHRDGVRWRIGPHERTVDAAPRGS
jgi:hypothetical protein